MRHGHGFRQAEEQGFGPFRGDLALPQLCGLLASARTVLRLRNRSERLRHERLWLEEAENRYRLYKAGKMSSRPAQDVHRDVRNRMR